MRGTAAGDYKYDGEGRISEALNRTSWIKTRYEYDLEGKVGRFRTDGMKEEVTYTHEGKWTYGKVGEVTKYVEKIGDLTYTTYQGYDKDQRATETHYNYRSAAGLEANDRTYQRKIYYDGYGRVTRQRVYEKAIGASEGTERFVTSYGYGSTSEGMRTNTQVVTMRNQATAEGGYNQLLKYTYDGNGRITHYERGSNDARYSYDESGQLTREDNEGLGKSWTWKYDAGGNIREKREYAYTTGTLGTAQKTVTYGYNNDQWYDELTSYDGRTITRDGVGNPLNDGIWTYTWRGGRELGGMSKSGTSIQYKYDGDGLRTEKTVNGKTVNGKTTIYSYTGSQLTHLMTEDEGNLYIRYDGNGEAIGLRRGGQEYTYVKNLQGDIIGLTQQVYMCYALAG